MEGGDPKRLRLDSVNPVFNTQSPRPPPPTTAQRHPSHPSHPTSTQVSSPPPTRHYPPHSLPPPTYPSPGPSHYAPPQPSPSLPPSDLRNLSDPRNIPSPGHRPHGLPGTPVTLPARNPIPLDNIASYARPPSAAPDLQSSRSTSFSDAKPPMEPASWPGNSDHRHGSHSNGYNPAMSPPHHASEQSYHTPPLPPGQHYSSQPPPGGYTPQTAYMGFAAGPGQMRRKQVRATQACNHCRARKQKCDEARPCQFCRENNFDCQYKDVPPPKQDRTMMQLQDGINNINDTLQNFIAEMSVWRQGVDSRLANIRTGEGSLAGQDHTSPGHMYGARGSMGDVHPSRMPTPMQARSQLRRADSIKTESPTGPHSHASPIPAYTSTPVDQKAILSTPQPPATPAESMDQFQTAETLSIKNPDASDGLQSDHTTPPHLLLADWPGVKSFCEGIPEFQKLEEAGKKFTEYPMLLESDRGLLRVWGVGEGTETNDGTQAPSSPESSAASDAPSPESTKEANFIYGFSSADQPSPSAVNGDSVGGFGPDGRFDLRAAVLRDLLQSYHEHIHCLHPFLSPKVLRRMVEDFIAVYSPESRMSKTMSPASVERLNPGVKRKRSASGLADGHGTVDEVAQGRIERSLRNAIILLVLALGKVCRYRSPLPAPHPDRNPTAGENMSRDSPQSANNSFGSSNSDSTRRNVDALPGMAYFSIATDILGNQQGGNTVVHAQAQLLAALYLSQFARVLESWSWINNACRMCLVLVKANYSDIVRNDGEPKEYSKSEAHRLNLVKCVYWTCLQLETDILAEMSNLHPTDVSKYQDVISYPSGFMDSFEHLPNNDTGDKEETMNLFIYSSLIHLRVILNGAHNTLYGANRKQRGAASLSNEQDVGAQAQSIADILKRWRTTLPDNLAWDDEEPPSTNINIARLRAKYYGGLYMVLRTSLRFAFDNLLPEYSDRKMDRNTLSLAHECIESAIRSTIAFDRVGAPERSEYTDFQSQRQGRLILTNIFGTLHAQFGNMIVLAAVCKSPLVYQLPKTSNLTKRNLALLFKRTVDILSDVAPCSPILDMDLKILDNAMWELGLHRELQMYQTAKLEAAKLEAAKLEASKLAQRGPRNFR